MRIAASLLVLLAAAPALAATSIPEPSTAGLFALGVLGVIVGRYGARTKRD